MSLAGLLRCALCVYLSWRIAHFPREAQFMLRAVAIFWKCTDKPAYLKWVISCVICSVAGDHRKRGVFKSWNGVWCWLFLLSFLCWAPFFSFAPAVCIGTVLEYIGLSFCDCSVCWLGSVFSMTVAERAS